MDFLTLKNLLWLCAAIGAVISFIANFQKIIDWFKKLGADKKAQPKLAISMENGGRGYGRANDNIYMPFEYNPETGIPIEHQHLVTYDFKIYWTFTIHITNQKEPPAYKVKLIPVEESLDKYNRLTFEIKPKIDLTKPFLHNTTKTFTITCSIIHHGTGHEAEQILNKYPFRKLRLEYYNLADVKFGSHFFSELDVDDESKNVYFKI